MHLYKQLWQDDSGCKIANNDASVSKSYDYFGSKVLKLRSFLTLKASYSLSKFTWFFQEILSVLSLFGPQHQKYMFFHFQFSNFTFLIFLLFFKNSSDINKIFLLIRIKYLSCAKLKKHKIHNFLVTKLQ